MAVVALAPLVPVVGRLALATGKGSLTRAMARSFATGAGFQAGAELVYGIAEWARSIDGDWDSEGEEPGGGVAPSGGCWKVEGGAAKYEERESPTDPFATPPGGECNITSCVVELVDVFPEDNLQIVKLTRTYTNKPQDTTQIQRNLEWEWRLNPACGGGECSSDPYPGSGGSQGPIDLGPIQAGDCNINVTFVGFLGNEDGTGKVEPVFYFEPVQETRASGGVIVGECNFQPTVSIGGGGDGGEPPRTYPNPPGSPFGDDWWQNLVNGLVTGAAAAVANQILSALLNKQAEGSFTLVAPCDKDDEGKNLTYTVDFPEQSAQDRMLDWQLAQAYLLQQHLNWKTPTCSHDQPILEGDFRTISFRSDETSPYGKSRLRKRFRYRSVSGNDLSAVVDHWKDFTWQGGPYRVRWVGNTWRTPEVWAASEAEGQRVIQHAAREAGFDPLEGGEWRTRVSSSTRLGVQSSLKVDTTGGYYWITARDGSDQRPIVCR
jgi:hypothetical protein